MTLKHENCEERNKECPEFLFNHKMSLLPLSIMMCVSSLSLGSRAHIYKRKELTVDDAIKSNKINKESLITGNKINSYKIS